MWVSVKTKFNSYILFFSIFFLALLYTQGVVNSEEFYATHSKSVSLQPHIELYILDKDLRIFLHNAKHNKDNYNIKFKGNLKYDYVPLTDIAGRFYIASDGEIQYKNTIIKIKEKAIFINGTRLQDEIASLLIHDNGEIILDAFLKQ